MLIGQNAVVEPKENLSTELGHCRSSVGRIQQNFGPLTRFTKARLLLLEHVLAKTIVRRYSQINLEHISVLYGFASDICHGPTFGVFQYILLNTLPFQYIFLSICIRFLDTALDISDDALDISDDTLDISDDTVCWRARKG